MRIFEIDHGGPENVGCTERDLRNYQRSLREEHMGMDAETFVDFLQSEKEKCSTFFFDYETDSDNRFSRCFWADSVSRRANIVFGDVVVFDTTYNTNKYGLIFAPFVGVNHHGQTILFGCGFLSDERTKSFVWLLGKFLKAMSSGAPKLIITDQDPAMTKAIAQVFPQTVHRYCLWHILNKFPDKLSPVIFRDHYQSIRNVIVHSTTSDEGVMENGISSSQRSESSHAFFKRYISNKNALMDFIVRFNKALRNQRHNELVADHIDMNERPKVMSNWPMETQMVKVYTKTKWLEFQKEVGESHHYYVEQVCTEIEFWVYHVMNFQASSSSKPRVLKHDVQRNDVYCSCMKFQFDGIPCRHMLAFFRVNQVFHLPDKYILKRWTQGAKVGALLSLSELNVIDDPERCLMSRHWNLSFRSSALVDAASMIEEGTKFLHEQFDHIDCKMKELNICIPSRNASENRRSVDKAIAIIDPCVIRTKGCEKRLNSTKEKATSKGRQCRGCGRRGVSHDKRNCPNLLDKSSANNDNKDDGSDEEDF
ncbi:protein FAR1-RELATED SEQUENCE 5-like [Henckelia pumila]|uniref:protein FAR1-RELATED SEQUENCE 5-like n=1 Tax=Henckelia pumila TaxID=405737 RepID=UPI003C6E1B86